MAPYITAEGRRAKKRLTSDELFEHRLAALLGRSIGEVLALPASEFDRWRQYWHEEPWGAYRDNLHAAIMCIQYLRTHVKKGTKLPSLEEFMLRLPDDVSADADAGRVRAKTFLATLRSIARKKKATP